VALLHLADPRTEDPTKHKIIRVPGKRPPVFYTPDIVGKGTFDIIPVTLTWLSADIIYTNDYGEEVHVYYLDDARYTYPLDLLYTSGTSNGSR
jgi:hypothetical protein